MTAWITIVTSAGALAVSALSIWCGYALFLAGATGQFKFNASSGSAAVGLESVAPGALFALFGAWLAAWTVNRAIGKS